MNPCVALSRTLRAAGFGLLHSVPCCQEERLSEPNLATVDRPFALCKCMSLVPGSAQTNASQSAKNVNGAPAVEAAEEVNEKELIFKQRTFDVYWVDKSALMYKDGIAKVRYVTVSTHSCARLGVAVSSPSLHLASFLAHSRLTLNP